MPVILVLEDDEDRSARMKTVLKERFDNFEQVFFNNAPQMITWLNEHLRETALICLDHDLGPNRQEKNRIFDPGTGRDVVDYLATQRPGCPVILHTTNSLAAPGMECALKEAGWKCSRVIPSADLEWIEAIWARNVSKLLNAKKH
jgi:CheY-like chemotaxis protein